MKFITLLTDFGLKDGYPGVMKGVIYKILAGVQIIDISHEIPPQNILLGSLVLSRSYRFFPAGSIHIAVVDPGVGTRRRPIATQLGEYFFVCPDNGLITPIMQEARANGETVEIVHLNQPQYWLPDLSQVFHGRDIFAPVGAHLAKGVPLTELGTPINDPILISAPQPYPRPDGWNGQVIDIDHFGNLSTNIHQDLLTDNEILEIRIAGESIKRLSRTFGEGQPGELVALIDSDNRMSVCVVNGSAAEKLHVRAGTLVEVLLRK